MNNFTSWLSWHKRNDSTDIKYPGVYLIAISENKHMAEGFIWTSDIVYIGMTNSIAGLKGRLKQFDNTINGKGGHGGADRVRYKHQDYIELTKRLFVSLSSFKCNVKSNEPNDLRVMGTVTKFEYDCLAYYVELFGRLPEFNDKKLSPKYSLTIGKKN